MMRDINLEVYGFPDEFINIYLCNEVYPNYGGNKKPLETLIRQLRQKYNPPCETAVVEKPYIDKDFLDEFSTFYSKSYRDYPSNCHRVHFFREQLPNSLSRSGSFEEYKNSYLGFVVIRPTDLQKMGRTMIIPPETANQAFHLCTSKNKATLLETELTIPAMPFVQQDTQVGACAQASIWMAGRYMSNKFGYRDFYPGEITQLARESLSMGRLFPAQGGLYNWQMLEAFRNMDLSPEYVSINNQLDLRHINIFSQKLGNNNFDKETLTRLYFADTVYKYLESEMPVVLMLPGHAVLAFGHEYDYEANGLANILRIPSFIYHNDAGGPYLSMPILYGAKKRISGGSPNFNNVEAAIHLLPNECPMKAEDAEFAGLEFFKRFIGQKILNSSKEEKFRDNLQIEVKTSGDLLEKFLFRTYLRRGVSFKQHVDSQDLIEADEIKHKISRLSLPKFVWIIEFTTEDGLAKQDEKGRRHCLGEIVIDASAPAESKCVIYLRVGNIIVLFNRHADDAPEYLVDSGPRYFFQHTRGIDE